MVKATAIVLLIIAVGYFGWKTSRNGYETAEYRVVDSDGDFEIREYSDMVVAKTSMNFKAQGEDGSFMRLFRYITGDNEVDQKVAMTTPVFMTQATENSAGTMSFVLPKEVAKSGAPKPTNANVEISTHGSRTYAVLRFAGKMNQESTQKNSKRLSEWIRKRKLETSGDPMFAGYDPPWTPGPLRRNEVLIPLK